MHENGQRIGEMLAEAVQGLARTAEPRADAAVQGSGEAAGGQVRAVAGQDGRLHELHLNPRVMRMASENLAQEILLAVNAALDDLRAGVPGLEAAELTDPQELAKTLGGVHADVMRRMDEFADGVELVVRRLEER
ncbi:YbaB/EbfC family nucleoid-associated protein [Streptosporangium sp. NBC_01495]|uniref:YbaB/EbfC family nucleoid-associated protein n=1 Tax=Streptosporangium sp. NBC_01495 TaxID=2903899 RepID=UPI002E348737|nr:YbaB/EbfC family nucleoid-associated protein [Streptosporangium sp. NBC_01495]